MIGFCGYNFCGDKSALNPFPTNSNNIKTVQIQNSIFDEIDISKDVSKDFSTDRTDWDFNTILNTDFSNGAGAGNVSFTLNQLTSIVIKKRKKGSFNWVTIKDIPINSEADLNLIATDYLISNNEEFEWALVPVLNGVEGQYITASLKTNFDGVFISDVLENYKLNANISYGNKTSNQSVGQIIPLGRKYPIIIKNSINDFDSGSVTGMLLGFDFENSRVINRKDVVNQTNEFLEFLKNGKPKIIKDWNGNVWICQIIGNPSITYNNNYGMGVTTVTFEWVEQGKYDNEKDLYELGFIE